MNWMKYLNGADLLTKLNWIEMILYGMNGEWRKCEPTSRPDRKTDAARRRRGDLDQDQVMTSVGALETAHGSFDKTRQKSPKINNRPFTWGEPWLTRVRRQRPQKVHPSPRRKLKAAQRRDVDVNGRDEALLADSLLFHPRGQFDDGDAAFLCRISSVKGTPLTSPASRRIKTARHQLGSHQSRYHLILPTTDPQPPPPPPWTR